MTTYRSNTAGRASGFTLVEILVVIVIIGLLAGLTTTVVVSARRSVNASVISSQEAQLSIALDEYKNRFGEYPPDLSDEAAVLRHIKKRWPRYNVPDYATFVNHIGLACRLSSGKYTSGTLPANSGDLAGAHCWQPVAYLSSLVFWLGGLPDADGVPCGFYASPKCPLGIAPDGTVAIRPERAKREKPMYVFEKKNIAAFAGSHDAGYRRVEQPIPGDAYIPAFIQGAAPVVYFRPSPDAPYGVKFFNYLNDSGEPSVAVPYAKTMTNNGVDWFEPNRFQLIHPGADNLFGSVPYGNTADDVRYIQPKSATLNTVQIADDDNVVNFAERGTLQSEYRDSTDVNQ